MTYFELNERYLIIKEQRNKMIMKAVEKGDKFLDDPNITRVEHYMSVLTDVMMCDDFSNIDKRRKSLELKGWANAIAEQAISKCYEAIKAFNEEA